MTHLFEGRRRTCVRILDELLLCSSTRQTRGSLAEHYSVCTKTITRDLRVWDMLNVPWYEEKTDEGRRILIIRKNWVGNVLKYSTNHKVKGD